MEGPTGSPMTSRWAGCPPTWWCLPGGTPSTWPITAGGRIGRVDFIDTASHRVTKSVEVGVRPLVAAISPLGEQLYIPCAGSNDLYVIDANEGRVIKEIPVGIGPDGIGLTPDGERLLVANSGTNDLSVVDLLDIEETRRVRVGEQPFSLTVNDQGYVFVVESGSRTISILSPELNKVRTVEVGKKPIDIQVSPDSRFVYVTDEKENRVMVLRISGLS